MAMMIKVLLKYKYRKYYLYYHSNNYNYDYRLHTQNEEKSYNKVVKKLMINKWSYSVNVKVTVP